MVGYTSAAFQLAKVAAKSSTGRKLAKEVVTSEATEKVLHEHVLPFAKERASNIANQSSFEEPGAWWEFTQVNPEAEGYNHFRTRQLIVIESYLDHILEFDGDDFSTYHWNLPERFPDDKVADQIASLIIELDYIFPMFREVLSFGVFDDDFLRHVRKAPIDYQELQGRYNRLVYEEDAETYRALIEIIDDLDRYSEHVFNYEFPSDEPEENPFAVIEQPLSSMPPYQLDFVICESLNRISYLEGFEDHSRRFRDHLDSFSPKVRDVREYRQAAEEVSKNQL